MILRRSIYVVVLVCLCSTVASGQFDFSISSDTAMPNAPSVVLDLIISGGGGATYDGVDSSVADGAVCDMGATATINAQVFDAGTIMDTGAAPAGDLYNGFLLPFGTTTTSVGTLWRYDIGITGGTVGEVCTFQPTGSESFLSGVITAAGTQTAGTIRIIPEPTGLSLLGAALMAAGLLRRRK